MNFSMDSPQMLLWLLTFSSLCPPPHRPYTGRRGEMGVHIAEEEENWPHLSCSYNMLITARPSPSLTGPPQACRMLTILLLQMGKGSWGWSIHLPQFTQLTQADLTLPTWLCSPHLHSSHPCPSYWGEIPAWVWGACAANWAAWERRPGALLADGLAPWIQLQQHLWVPSLCCSPWPRPRW